MTTKADHRFVHVIVAHGDAADDLRRLHSSLASQYGSTGGGVAGPSLLVVCNDVSEETARSAEAIAEERFGLANLHTPCNIGYGPAINFARKQIKHDPEWLVVGNADLVWPDGSMQGLVDVLDKAESDVACIAPRLLDDASTGGGLQPSVGRFPTLWSLLAGRLRSRTTRKYRRTPVRGCDIDWATGACLALRLRALDAIGGFDESIFLDYEETDFCKRLAGAGWRRRYEPAWSMVHTAPNAQRPADPTRHRHTRASMVRYVAKHRPAWELHVLGALMKMTMRLRGKSSDFAPGWQSGIETYSQLRGRQIP